LSPSTKSIVDQGLPTTMKTSSKHQEVLNFLSRTNAVDQDPL
jgi:hypothetical protein